LDGRAGFHVRAAVLRRRGGRPGELAIGSSQSGETPDVVAWLGKAREAGSVTVAITNGEGSSLAAAAERAGVDVTVALA
jgi:glucosamine--fructose-6-phosphate aminotransferase (isomerizing)